MGPEVTIWLQARGKAPAAGELSHRVEAAGEESDAATQLLTSGDGSPPRAALAVWRHRRILLGQSLPLPFPALSTPAAGGRVKRCKEVTGLAAGIF